MLLLRREYRDPTESPEIVFLHAEVFADGADRVFQRRTTQVASPTAEPGLRAAHISIPDLPEGVHARVRYRFSSVCCGREWCSPFYEVEVPSNDLDKDLHRIPEEEGGNLVPASGSGYFRLVLPMEEGEQAGEVIRYGFGAMRKKPSLSLCRAAADAGDGKPPVIEIPEALSVLKNRPMPYFLYHIPLDGELRQNKIACARITLRDEPGETMSARLVWGDPLWRAVNMSPMEVKGMVAGECRACDEYFAQDPFEARAERFAIFSSQLAPRTFEAFLFGPSGRPVEYCFQAVVRLASGKSEARWLNREGGGNWSVTL